MKKLLCVLFFVAGIFHFHASGQNEKLINLGFISDELSNELTLIIQSEIKAILDDKFDLRFNVQKTKEFKNQSQITDFYSSNDLVISVGINSSFLVSNVSEYLKPTVISFVFDHYIQGIPLSSSGTSGKKNLTYVESPFDLKRDFKTLYDIIPYKKLAIVGDGGVSENNHGIMDFLQSISPEGTDVALFSIRKGATNLMVELDSFDAVYFFPVDEFLPKEELRTLYHELADKGKVTFSLISKPAIDLGVYAAYESDKNLNRIPRRVALNIMKILEGQKAEDLNVQMDAYIEDLLINMAIVNHSGVYPKYNLLNNASMQNLSAQVDDHDIITLEGAVAEALQNNLQLSISKKEVDIGSKDISIAKSNLLPQIDGNASVYNLDKTRTILQGQGTLGSVNLNAGLTLNQIVFSEPVLASIAIQKLLNESNKYALEVNELDVVQNVINAYIGILQAKAFVDLNNDNLNVTRQNYNIARIKQTVGESGASDVYRWQSQQALQNVEVNNALAQLRSARQGLNFLLNRPTDELHEVEDINHTSLDIMLGDERFFDVIDNESKAMMLSNFLVEEAFSNLPEIKQIEASLKAQQRSLQSQSRAFYLPQVVLSGSLTQPLGHYNVPEEVMRVDDVPRQTQISMGLQIPIFQGNARRYQKQQTELEILQTKDNRELLMDNLELVVRNNIAFVGASFQNLNLTKQAADAAARNFEIAQDSYQEGLLNITSLIDAQNALLQANINSINAEYIFLTDFIALERSYGKYYFLMPRSERESFFIRFNDFLSTRKN